MRHGDEVRILVDGPFLRLKSLEPIGISDKSQCWGIWIEKRLREGEVRNPADPLDFIISPIHPSLWPFAFRVEAALHSVAGTLKSIATQLNENNVNILFVDQSPAGYTHSIFNAICAFDMDHEMLNRFEAMETEIYGLRWASQKKSVEHHAQKKTDDDAKQRKALFTELDPSTEAEINRLRSVCFQDIGLMMIARLAGLWASLRNAEQDQYEARKKDEGDIFFLAPRVVEQGLEPWLLKILDLDGALLKIGPETSDQNGEEKMIADALKTRADNATLLMNTILETPFPIVQKASEEPSTVKALLKKMKDSHRKTYNSAVQRNDDYLNRLTVQATLANMDDSCWMHHVLRRIAWRHVHLPLGVQALVRLAEMRCWMSPRRLTIWGNLAVSIWINRFGHLRQFIMRIASFAFVSCQARARRIALRLRSSTRSPVNLHLTLTSQGHFKKGQGPRVCSRRLQKRF
jgi:hypothetical protein